MFYILPLFCLPFILPSTLCYFYLPFVLHFTIILSTIHPTFYLISSLSTIRSTFHHYSVYYCSTSIIQCTFPTFYHHSAFVMHSTRINSTLHSVYFLTSIIIQSTMLFPLRLPSCIQSIKQCLFLSSFRFFNITSFCIQIVIFSRVSLILLLKRYMQISS